MVDGRSWDRGRLTRTGLGLLAAAGALVLRPSPWSELVAAEPAELVGHVDLLEARNVRKPAAGAVVWLPGVALPAGTPTAVTLAQKDKRFQPHVLAVPRGASVAFPNDDRVFHNVFSRSPGQEFDLGLYRKGASRERRFERPGLVRVYCNIHAQMAAYLMVLDSVFTLTDERGDFRIAGVPAGRQEVRVWHERAGEQGASVDVLPQRLARLDLSLDASAFREDAHKNKHGQDYPPVDQDADRY